ncbi:hypothetical protein HYPSUDRAFT_209560 [Hypholoma sublateritium FD-334 SS-4]|uniref:Uncharacterized protein n=1 Tax=Hypholoma sublateritium (strain FD-334 SS-4) TaxID=945553 RepID=A0A0D2N2E4_HYPSF|nr:hypothetical protein HYPSUDRAFT_209560 [Hypholoma sublateritium FD-334 SS-4]
MKTRTPIPATPMDTMWGVEYEPAVPPPNRNAVTSCGSLCVANLLLAGGFPCGCGTFPYAHAHANTSSLSNRARQHGTPAGVVLRSTLISLIFTTGASDNSAELPSGSLCIDKRKHKAADKSDRKVRCLSPPIYGVCSKLPLIATPSPCWHPCPRRFEITTRLLLAINMTIEAHAPPSPVQDAPWLLSACIPCSCGSRPRGGLVGDALGTKTKAKGGKRGTERESGMKSKEILRDADRALLRNLAFCAAVLHSFARVAAEPYDPAGPIAPRMTSTSWLSDAAARRSSECMDEQRRAEAQRSAPGPAEEADTVVLLILVATGLAILVVCGFRKISVEIYPCAIIDVY